MDDTKVNNAEQQAFDLLIFNESETCSCRYTIPVYVAPKIIKPPTISKEIDTTNIAADEAANRVTWLITVTGQDDVKEFDIVDQWDGATSEIVSAQVKRTSDESFSDASEIVSTGKYHVEHLHEHEEIMLKVVTKIKDDVFINADKAKKDINISNEASLQKEGQDWEISDRASKTVHINWISKKGSQDIRNIKQINWEVTVNSNHMLLNNYMFTDYIPRGLELDTASVKVYELDEDLKTVKQEVLGLSSTVSDSKLEAPVVDINNDGNNDVVASSSCLEIGLPNTNATYRITYSTDINDGDNLNWENNKSQTYYNIAGIGSGVSRYYNFYGAKATSTMLEKAGVYDPSTESITWTIKLNKNKSKLLSPMIEDEIKDGMIYEEGSFEAKRINGVDSANLSNMESVYKEADHKISAVFSGDVEAYWQITYRTKVINPMHTAVNLPSGIKYDNTAVLIINNRRIDEVPAQAEVKSKVIEKTPVSYDFVNRVLTWRIEVNQNEMSLPSDLANGPLVIGDILAEGQAYEGIELYQVTKENNNIIETKENADEWGHVLIEGTNIKYIFDRDINHTYALYLKAKITDINGVFGKKDDYKCVNTATLSGSKIPEEQTSTSEMTIENPLFKKVGVQDGDSINWTMIINANRIEINEPIMQDVLPYGLEVEPSSIRLVKMAPSAQVVAVDHLRVAQTLSEQGKVTLEEGDYQISTVLKDGKLCHKLTVKIPGDMGESKPGHIREAYKLTFTTKVTEKPQTEYINEATFAGEGLNENNVAGQVTVVFNRNYASGWASGYKGVINIHKVEKDHPDIALQGVTFALYKDGYNIGRTATTDAFGRASFTKLKTGDDIVYQIKEIEAPEGYECIEGFIDNNGSNELILSNAQKILDIEVEDAVKKFPVYIKKVDKDNGQEVIPGTTFAVFKADEYDEHDLSNSLVSKVTDDQGKASFELPYGIYTLVELEASTGYAKATTRYDLEVKKNGIVTINGEQVTQDSPMVIENKKLEGVISIAKTDKKGNPVHGVTYNLYKSSYVTGDEPIKNAVTNNEGIARFEEVAYGEYEVIEVSAPAQYVIDATPIHIVAHFTTTEKEIKTSQVDEFRGDYMIYAKKVNLQGKPLGQAEFALYDETHRLIAKKKTEPDTGIAAFSTVSYGTYTLEEVTAPVYYVIGEKNEKTFTIQPDKKEMTIVFEDDLGRDGHIQVTKISTNNKKLQGAVFTLYNAQGEVVATACSQEDGIATFTGVTYGEYTLQETMAPSGYIKSKEVLAISVKDDQIHRFTMTNKKRSDSTPEINTFEVGGGKTNTDKINIPVPLDKDEETLPVSKVIDPKTGEEIPVQEIIDPTTGERKFIEVKIDPETDEATPTGFELDPSTGERKASLSSGIQEDQEQGQKESQKQGQDESEKQAQKNGKNSSNSTMSNAAVNSKNNKSTKEQELEIINKQKQNKKEQLLPMTGSCMDSMTLFIVGLACIVIGIGLQITRKKGKLK